MWHWVGIALSQTQPGSFLQKTLQPSPLAALLSSQSSIPATMPSPQVGPPVLELLSLLLLPLGAGRLTREWLPDDPPGRRRVAMLRDWLDTELAGSADAVLEAGNPDLAVATSKTFRSLARLTGAAPSGAGPRVKRTLTANGLRQLIAFISRMAAADRAELEGVSAERAPQIVAGALVAEASMRALGIDTVDICPWALREGLILRKLDSEADGTALVETPVGDAGSRADRQQAARNGGKASDRSRGNRR